MSKTRQPSSPRSPRQSWQDTLRVARGKDAGGLAVSSRVDRSPVRPTANHGIPVVSTHDRGSRRFAAGTLGNQAAGGSLRVPSSTSNELVRGAVPRDRASSAAGATGTAGGSLALSGGGASPRAATAGKIRRGGAASPRRAPAPPPLGRCVQPTTNANSVSSNAPAAPMFSDAPLDTNQLAQLAAAPLVSRQRLTQLLEEVKGEIGRILESQRSDHPAAAPAEPLLLQDRNVEAVGGTGETSQAPQASASDIASGTSATISPVGGSSLSAAPGPGSTGGGAEGHVAEGFEATGSPPPPLHDSIVQQLCSRVGHLQGTLDTAWEAGLEPVVPPTVAAENWAAPLRPSTASDSSWDMIGTSASAAPAPETPEEQKGFGESVAGLTRLEEMLARLEAQVSASFPLLKSAAAEGGRRDELCVAVGELEQQKKSLEAEVRALREQKQEIEARASARSSIPLLSGGRASASGGRASAALKAPQVPPFPKGEPRSAALPIPPSEELPGGSRSSHLISRSNKTGAAAMPVQVVLPTSMVSVAVPASAAPLTATYARTSPSLSEAHAKYGRTATPQVARLNTPPRHGPAPPRLSTPTAPLVESPRRIHCPVVAPTIQAPLVGAKPLHAWGAQRPR